MHRPLYSGRHPAGGFYATQGPRFSLTLEDGLLTVTCSPVSSVIFFSDLVYAPDRVTTGDRDHPGGLSNQARGAFPPGGAPGRPGPQRLVLPPGAGGVMAGRRHEAIK